MRKRLLKIFLIFLGVTILLLLLIPGFVRRYTINHSKELTGRQINIEKLKYNYFTSTVTIYDFKMLEENEQTNFLDFDTLIVNLKPLKLFNDKIEIEDFHLIGLDVNVFMKDSLFNFDDLIDFHSSTKDSVPQNTEEPPFKFSVSNIYIEKSDFHFNNQDIDHITNIENLSFLVPFIGWDQEEKSNADVKFKFPRGGYFETKLNINPFTGDYDANITIHELYLDYFYKYAAENAEINSLNGALNSNIDIIGNTNEVVKSIVSGRIEINDFTMTDRQDKNFISAKKLDLDLKEIDAFNKSYIIDSFNVRQPYTYFKQDSITNNFFQIFKIDAATEESIEDNIETIEESIYYAINHFEVHEGIIDYTDNLTGNPFNYHLSRIEIESDSILSDAKWININSDMLLNNRGTLKAQLGFSPSNTDNLNLDISIEKFLLSDINIYTKYYMGHTILEGDMYYQSNSKITNGNIESENKLLVKDVSLNNTEKGLYNLPLKFALFLLKDKNGDVNLDIPIQGDLNDPSINVGKIVWSTFKNLIVKVATSPGRLLAGLVGADPKDIEEIKFTYLDSTPSEKNKKQLDKLLEIERKKEGLKIEMIYYVDTNLQKEAIAKDEVGKLFFEETNKDYLKNKIEFESFVMNKITPDSLSLKQAYLQIATPKAIDSLVTDNNKMLISNSEQYLKMANDSTHIKIIRSDALAPNNTGSLPILKVNFSLLEND